MPTTSEPDSTSSTLAHSITAAHGAARKAAPAANPPPQQASSGLPSAPTEEQLASAETPPRFAALRHRNFRLFWFGNLISLFGTLAQQTAQGWLMRLLTEDPLVITAVAACGWLPITVLTLYAGVVADRVDKRRAMLVTNGLSAVLALILAALVWLDVVQVWHVAAVSLAGGVVLAFDIPARQSFNVEMVGRDDLPNAIALNSTAFNSARVAGPAIGGWLLHTVGRAGCFFVNALSFLPLIAGLLMMRLPQPEAPPKDPQSGEFWEGVRFVRGHPTLRLVILLAAVVSVFGMSFTTLLPVFAKDVFDTDERGFSLLMTCNGAGALGSALSLAAAGAMRHKGKRLLLGSFLFCLSVIAFASASSLSLACFFLVLAGWFLFTFLTTANTMVQTLAPDDLRGRVFSLYSLALIGTLPLGALLLGGVARVNARFAVQLGAVVAAAFTVWIYLRFRRLWKEK
ncbi:MAG TPA: MFS transporter [Abditibacteriaceae bacterium]|nr:MFS transporter [Abditibacteriaceae bacterium]